MKSRGRRSPDWGPRSIKAANWVVHGPLRAPSKDFPAEFGVDVVSFRFRICFGLVSVAFAGSPPRPEKAIETKSKRNPARKSRSAALGGPGKPQLATFRPSLSPGPFHLTNFWALGPEIFQVDRAPRMGRGGAPNEAPSSFGLTSGGL